VYDIIKDIIANKKGLT